MKQRLDEWLSIVNDYHEKQFRKPMRSTAAFCDWLEEQTVLHKDSLSRILDAASGQGANIAYMKRRFPNCAFLGIDINSDLVQRGNEYFEELKLVDCRLEQGDIFNLETRYRQQFDGVTCYQSLMCFPEFQTPLAKMLELDPAWIGLTTLCFDGQVSCRIEVQDYTTPLPSMPYKPAFYNVYAIPHIKQLFERYGFDYFVYAPFEIDTDLEKPASGGMGTYTVKLEGGRRLQISGPVLMSWYFILGAKTL